MQVVTRTDAGSDKDGKLPVRIRSAARGTDSREWASRALASSARAAKRRALRAPARTPPPLFQHTQTLTRSEASS
jgi:hypothetical protein